MADKEKKGEDKSAAAAAPAAEKKAGGGGGGGGLLKSTPMLLGVVMVVEAAVLFGGFKFLGGGPKRSDGAEPKSAKADDKDAKPDPRKLVEVPVLEFKAPNRVNGNSYLYDVQIFVSARPEHKEALAQVIADRSATIKDRVRTIISQSDPSKLGGGTEPGLETLRRQVKYQLDEIVGEGMVEEVLIAKCIPYRSEF